VKENILELEISVNNILGVKVVDTRQQSVHERNNILLRQCSSLFAFEFVEQISLAAEVSDNVMIFVVCG